MIYVVGVILLLGLLIFFHELGHFLVARKFGVRVEVFSFGFGPKIAKLKRGETEYCISLVPLGGYVKLFGEQPSADISSSEKARSFSHKPPGERFLIALAGPVANFLLALVVFLLIGLTGEPKATTTLPHVVLGSEAWKAGLRSGDQILTLNDDPVRLWDDVEERLADLKNGDLITLNLARSLPDDQ
ncbi:MAG: RIP metalloprotease RseP, partial [Deltaproteobacteria bacterium]|nr:RIP metalloprotease RseP [Deltaproteobacteria bacterium]